MPDSLLARLLAPWRYQRRDVEILDALERIDSAVTSRIPARLALLETSVANTAPLLNQLAQDLRSWTAGPFAALLADNARLAARNAELEGEDAAETSAADNAVSALNELIRPVTDSPEIPVEIPPVEVPDVPADEDSPPAA